MAFGPVTRDHTAPQSHDWGRRRMRTGAARVAREMRDTGHGLGKGFRAEQIMRSTSSRNLNRMAEGMNPVAVTQPTSRYCNRCKARGQDPWQPPDHAC